MTDGLQSSLPTKKPSNNGDNQIEICLKTLLLSYLKLWPRDEVYKYVEGLPAAVSAVDRYYRDFLPGEIPRNLISTDEERMNLIVISESHARTNPDIVGKPILEEYHCLVPQQYRKGHVNLVHCLSYGEAWLAGVESDTGAKAGTPQFWRLLSALSGDLKLEEKLTAENWDQAFQHLSTMTCKDRHVRVRNKIKVLEDLKHRKIELLDLCLVHIYLASGSKKVMNRKGTREYTTPNHKIPDKTKKAILLASWEQYTKPLLRQKRPRNVLFLGKTLVQAISEPEIMKFCQEIECEYHDPMLHPSFKAGKTYAAEMEAIRKIANDAVN